MAITPFKPRTLASAPDDVERLFQQFLGIGDDSPVTAGAFSPSLDVREDSNEFTLYVELPGVSSDDVDITLEDNVLTISGQRSSYEDVEEGEFRRVERHFGRFHRSVRLPDRVVGDEVNARYADGVLTITVPKAEEAKPRRIAIEG